MSSSATMASANYLPDVRAHYEALPYPPYDPAQDKTQLVTNQMDRLDYINQLFFDGRHRFGNDFRALSAGDGTGNASVYLGEQLLETGGDVVALDLTCNDYAADLLELIDGVRNIRVSSVCAS
jgi:hypothetical protein